MFALDIFTATVLGWWLLEVGVVCGMELTTNGDSGEACGQLGKRCIAGQAICDNVTNSCQCSDHVPFGSGDIKCYPVTDTRWELLNDPEFRGYQNISISLPFPCRYLLSHTVTDLFNTSGSISGTCEFMTHVFNSKWRGKFYVRGYDVAIKIVYNNGTEKKMSIKVQGTAFNGSYHFMVNATDYVFLPQGPWNDDIIDYYDQNTNLSIKVDFDTVNNLAVLDAKNCGIDIQFRPYDLDRHQNQLQTPHLAYLVNSAYSPQFKSLYQVIALPSNGIGNPVDKVLLPGSNREETFLVRALNFSGTPTPKDYCQIAGRKLNKRCKQADVPLAVKRCIFILKSPRFIHCYDTSESGIKLMRLFNRCIEFYCGLRSRTCQYVIDLITKSGCDQIRNPYPEVDAFVNGSLCTGF